jgi:ribosome-associated protein
MESRKMAQRCRELAENRKAENVVVLDVHEVSGITDYLVVATGSSEPHLRAIQEEIIDKLLEEDGVRPLGVDGVPGSTWVVIDLGDVMVHVMEPEARERFDLESLWGDAPRIRRRRAAAREAKVEVPGTPASAAADPEVLP